MMDIKFMNNRNNFMFELQMILRFIFHKYIINVFIAYIYFVFNRQKENIIIDDKLNLKTLMINHK